MGENEGNCTLNEGYENSLKKPEIFRTIPKDTRRSTEDTPEMFEGYSGDTPRIE